VTAAVDAGCGYPAAFHMWWHEILSHHPRSERHVHHLRQWSRHSPRYIYRLQERGRGELMGRWTAEASRPAAVPKVRDMIRDPQAGGVSDKALVIENRRSGRGPHEDSRSARAVLSRAGDRLEKSNRALDHFLNDVAESRQAIERSRQLLKAVRWGLLQSNWRTTWEWDHFGGLVSR